MGVAFYIIVEGQQNAGSEIVGKAIARAEPIFMKQLHEDQRSLSDFVSVSNDEMADFFDDEGDMPEIETKWFDPADGIRTLDAYLGLMKSLKALPDRDDVAEDLNAMRSVLERAKQTGDRWRLGIDF